MANRWTVEEKEGAIPVFRDGTTLTPELKGRESLQK
jgi:hypothetical protein